MTREQESTTEDLTAEAAEIIATVEGYRGTVTMKGLGAAEFVDTYGNETEIVLRTPVDEFTAEMYAARGFTEQEMNEGIMIIIGKGQTRKYKNVTITDDGTLKVAEEQPDRTFAPGSLTDQEMDQLGATALLSALPGRIVRKYGDVEGFKAHLSTKPKVEVDTLLGASPDAVYGIGFGKYITGAQMMREGSMHAGTSDLRSIIGSTGTTGDKNAYYETLVKRTAAAKARMKS